MGSLKVALCAVVAVAAVTLTPASHATDSPATDSPATDSHGSDSPGTKTRGAVSVTPSDPAPGTEIALRVTGCAGRTGSAASPAFVADAGLVGSEGSGGSDGALSGGTRVRSSLAPGTYDVTVTCGERRVAGRIHVPSASDRSSAPASPVAPVLAGGGGTAPLAAAGDARVEGPGMAHAVTGVLLAGGAAVAVALRRARRRRRGTD